MLPTMPPLHLFDALVANHNAILGGPRRSRGYPLRVNAASLPIGRLPESEHRVCRYLGDQVFCVAEMSRQLTRGSGLSLYKPERCTGEQCSDCLHIHHIVFHLVEWVEDGYTG